MGAMVKSSSVFSSACYFRRMMMSSSSSSSTIKDLDLFLVSRFSLETHNYYFSLLSTETGAIVRDFHSPHFNGTSKVKLSRCEGGLVHLHHAPNDERLWNPRRNEFKLVPPYKNRSAFEHSFFGYDPKSQDYKIIRLVRNYFGGDGHYGVPQAELYSLRNDSWKEILDCPCLNYNDYNFNSYSWCYADGCCNWETDKGNIISFDFAAEKFTSLSLPIPAGTGTGTRRFGMFDKTGNVKDLFDVKLLEFDGLLGAIISYPFKSHQELDGEIWVWNNESWTRKFEFRLAGVSGILGFGSDSRTLFLMDDACDQLLRFDVHTKRLKKCNQLLRYDVHIQQIKKFDIYDFSPNRDMEVFPYYDSEVDFNCSKL